MLAVIPVRDGLLPSGADETIAECGGEALVVGRRVDGIDVAGLGTRISLLELDDFDAPAWADAITRVLVDHVGITDGPADVIVLPASPDGRDLAPHIAIRLDRPLYAGALTVSPSKVSVAVGGSRELHDHHVDGPFVATLQPGVRGVAPNPGLVDVVLLEDTQDRGSGAAEARRGRAETVELLPPDVRTMDLSEARRIVGGGAGLDDASRFTQLDEFATAIGASTGATRVITDRNWVHHDKQIGTTGVVVDPDLYISFGISGAVQHTAGLGDPAHIISVNTDAHCPMMAMSDLAIVSDANATLDELLLLLAARLGASLSEGPVTEATGG